MTKNISRTPPDSPAEAADGSIDQLQENIRERKRVEEDLRGSEWRIGSAIVSARLTYVEVDLVRGTARTPENFAAVMGYASPPDQETDMSAGTRRLLEHVVPQDRARVAASQLKFLAGTPSAKLDYRVLGDDRVERWIETRWSVELGTDGKRLKSFATNRDITERKRAEEAIRASEERYRSLFNSMDQGFCILEMIFDERQKAVDWRYLEVNPTFGKQTGLHDATGKRMRELAPDLEADWFETLGKVALTGEPVRFVNEAKSLGGRWFDVYSYRVGGPDSRKVALLFTNITERKQVEEAFRVGEQRLRFVMDSMPQKIVTATPDGGMDYFNPQWSEFTGLSFEQIKGWGWKQFVHPDDLPETERIWRHSIVTGDVSQSEQRFRRADGQYRWHLTRSAPMRDAAGKIEMWIGSSTDVHEVKEADRRKDEFLALLAHELRNPLAPVLNMLEVLKRVDGQSDLIQPALSMMERQMRQMTRLIDDLLDVSRISQGKIDLRREKVDLASVVRQVVEASLPAYEAAQQDLSVTLPALPVYVHADPVRLAQVFGNLLHNASKFSRAKGRISLAVERQSDDVVVTVKDCGIGILPGTLPKIFEMFAQGDQTLERTHSGLGIGLTLVRRLVDMHGGSVHASSEGVDRGSEFVVRLPMLSEKGEALPPNPAFAATTPAAARRILVVDDNRDAAESLALLLQLDGNQTHLAFDGVEAVEAATSFRPEVILMDIGMPKLNGYEAARRIRDQPWGKSMVLVALTGWGQGEDQKKTADAGFDGHLVKPVNYAALTKLLDKFSAA